MHQHQSKNSRKRKIEEVDGNKRRAVLICVRCGRWFVAGSSGGGGGGRATMIESNCDCVSGQDSTSFTIHWCYNPKVCALATRLDPIGSKVRGWCGGAAAADNTDRVRGTASLLSVTTCKRSRNHCNRSHVTDQ